MSLPSQILSNMYRQRFALVTIPVAILRKSAGIELVHCQFHTTVLELLEKRHLELWPPTRTWLKSSNMFQLKASLNVGRVNFSRLPRLRISASRVRLPWSTPNWHKSVRKQDRFNEPLKYYIIFVHRWCPLTPCALPTLTPSSSSNTCYAKRSIKSSGKNHEELAVNMKVT